MNNYEKTKLRGATEFMEVLCEEATLYERFAFGFFVIVNKTHLLKSWKNKIKTFE